MKGNFEMNSEIDSGKEWLAALLEREAESHRTFAGAHNRHATDYERLAGAALDDTTVEFTSAVVSLDEKARRSVEWDLANEGLGVDPGDWDGWRAAFIRRSRAKQVVGALKHELDNQSNLASLFAALEDARGGVSISDFDGELFSNADHALRSLREHIEEVARKLIADAATTMGRNEFRRRHLWLPWHLNDELHGIPDDEWPADAPRRR
jgi:hypothetical protein